MQRKNNFLKSSKNGFAMMMALAVIVILGTIMAFSINLTSKTTKQSIDLYLYEQAQLYAKSATEYALLKIAKDGECNHTNDLNFIQDGIYDINISLKYIYTYPSPCTPSKTFSTVTTPEQNGSVIIDVAINIPQERNITSEPIRYFRRTIQKL
jgi:Tfp pilus assembly protein PilX